MFSFLLLFIKISFTTYSCLFKEPTSKIVLGHLYVNRNLFLYRGIVKYTKAEANSYSVNLKAELIILVCRIVPSWPQIGCKHSAAHTTRLDIKISF